MALIKINNVQFAYDIAGSGPAVVLVHAGCADRRMWQQQFDKLSEHYRVIRYDWRGYGDSDDATSEFSHHEDLLALMDALGIKQAAIVGSSDGGKIAVDAALTAPERITALVLVAAGLSEHVWPPSMLAQYQERVHRMIGIERLKQYRTGQVETIDLDELDRYSKAETEFLVAGPRRTRADLTPEAWKLALAMDRRLNERSWSRRQTISRPLQPPAKARLDEVHVPTLIVNGDADVPEIIELSDYLAASIKGARQLILPGTGHLPPLERPDEFNNALFEFLASVRLS
jgi:pimeloyl-ACP methyl ester carboxylesterase